MCERRMNGFLTVRSRSVKAEITKSKIAWNFDKKRWGWRNRGMDSDWNEEKQRSEGGRGRHFWLLQLSSLNQVYFLLLPTFIFQFSSVYVVQINLTLFILISFTAINTTLFCQLSDEYNSNSLCMHICVCVFPVRRLAFNSRSFIAFCPLSFYVTPVKSFVSICVCVCGNKFQSAAYQTSPLCIVLCMLPSSLFPGQII